MRGSLRANGHADAQKRGAIKYVLISAPRRLCVLVDR